MSSEKISYKIINGITIYRIAVSPVLVILILNNQFDAFRWMLAISFFTDFIDGFLARQFKVVSLIGARLDSIGDDLTIVAAVIGLYFFEFEFIKSAIPVLAILFSIFVLQNVYALVKFHKTTSFHTYLAKVAAFVQGVFLILIYFFHQPLLGLFYAAVIITALDLIEEIVLVYILPKWEANVKGIYWVLRKLKTENKQF